MEKRIIKAIIRIQKDEINGYHTYNRLAGRISDQQNASVLKNIANHELKHYHILKRYSGREVKPSRLKVWTYVLMARTLGLIFSLKLMEKNENRASRSYGRIREEIPEVSHIIEDEDAHEQALIDMIGEEGLKYAGSIVLGLNDALVELTGAIAGFTFAIQDSQKIAVVGLITGISAALSMAASEFLSQREEDNHNEAARASLYTGIAYIATVIMLVLPYLFVFNPFKAFAAMMLTALIIILIFNFYISVAKDLDFKKRFLEMTLISFGVAALSFAIGWLVRTQLGIEI